MAMTPPPSPASQTRVSRGSTLLEVLVAILVLSIGLLGIAGLQTASLRYSQGGWARAAVASNLSDLAERIRTNPNSAENAYALATTYDDQRTAIAALKPIPKCESTGVTCTPDELAAFHVAAWRLALDRDMPGGAGFVIGTRDTGYVATVIWFDKSNVTPDGKAIAPTSCTGATGINQRTCCPDAVKAPDGARCTNMLMLP